MGGYRSRFGGIQPILGDGGWMVFRELPSVAAQQLTSLLLVHGEPLSPLDRTGDVGNSVGVGRRYGC